MQTINIIGGGIGGLSLANALQEQGIDFYVYEQADQLKEVGAAIGLSHAAVIILENLGLEIKSTSTSANILQLTGKDLKPFRVVRVQTPGIIIHRARLIEILQKNLPKEKIHLNKKLSSIESLEESLYRVEVIHVPGDYAFWSRDSGPAFTINQLGDRRAVDFNHTGYYRYVKRLTDVGSDSATVANYKKDVQLMMKNDSLMASIKQASLLKSWVFVEGGAYEVNGKGSLMVSEPFLFRNCAPEMRDTLTRKHFEEEFNRTLGVTNVIWLSEGLAEDGGWGSFFGKYYIAGGTNGHADEFARFANENTILLAWVEEDEKDLNPIKQASYERMKRNYEILKEAKDQNGKPFTVIKVPIPTHFIQDRILTGKQLEKDGVRAYYERNGLKEGDTLKYVAATSYLNYLVTNNKLLLPTYIKYNTPVEREEKVKQIFTELFPDHELVFMDVMQVNTNGGGIHCITRQVPTRKSSTN